jgi:hypothetical protein
MKNIAHAAMLVAVILIAYNITDRIEQNTEAKIAAAESFEKGCMPSAGETSIIVSNGRSARCRIYSSASTSTGMAPRLVSAAVVEVNP